MAALVCAQSAELPDLLQRVLKGNRTLDVTGVRQVYGGPPGRGFTFTEQFSQRGPMIRLDYPAGSPNQGQIVVDTPRDRRHYLPGPNEVWVSPPRFDLRMERIAFLGRKGKLKFTVTEGKPVADLATKVLIVQSPEGRALQRLSIHPESGLVLKREMLGPDGRPLGGFAFTRVDLKAGLTKEDFRISTGDARIIRPEDRHRELAMDNGFVLRPIRPLGYRLDTVDVFNKDGSKTLVLSYSGMEGRISYFQSNKDLDEKRLRRFAGSNASTYGWSEGGRYFVLLGDLPSEALRQIATGR